VLQWVLHVVTAGVCSFFTSWNLVLLSDELEQSVSVSLNRLSVVKLLRLHVYVKFEQNRSWS
jgi:hypothetical protein